MQHITSQDTESALDHHGNGTAYNLEFKNSSGLLLKIP